MVYGRHVEIQHQFMGYNYRFHGVLTYFYGKTRCDDVVG